ncbi:hypothetical protein A9974_12925 [Achromobacter sp. UMC71]|nr:hypothetical protein [Achromobacter sp. UMC71]
MWKLLPLWLVLPAGGVWLHLYDAGWESLFLEAVVSWSGLGVLLAAGLLGCLVTTLLIVSPALTFFSGMRADMVARAARGARFTISTRLAWLTTGCWLAALAGVRYLADTAERWVPGAGVAACMAAGSALALAVLALAAVWTRKRLTREWRDDATGFWRVLGATLGLAGAMMVMSLAPFLILVALLEPLAGEMGSGFALLIVLGLTFGLSFLPVLALLSAPANAGKSGKMTAWTVVVFVVVALLAGNYGSLVQWVLKPMGVYRTAPQHYLMVKPEAAAAVSAAGLALMPVRGGQAVRAYQRFALGGVLLVCQRASPLPGQARGAGCAALRRDDVIPYQPAAPAATPGSDRPKAKRPRRMDTLLPG